MAIVWVDHPPLSQIMKLRLAEEKARVDAEYQKYYAKYQIELWIQDVSRSAR